MKEVAYLVLEALGLQSLDYYTLEQIFAEQGGLYRYILEIGKIVDEVGDAVEAVERVVETDHGSMNLDEKRFAVLVEAMTMLVASHDVEVLAVDSMIAASLYQNLACPDWVGPWIPAVVKGSRCIVADV